MARTWKAGAIRRGREDGENAAGWWIQEMGGGRDTRPIKQVAEQAERILARMDGNDEMIDGELPHADLSGQWADQLNSNTLVEDVTGGPDEDAGPTARNEKIAEAYTDLCDAYEEAFEKACSRSIRSHLRGLIRQARTESR